MKSLARWPIAAALTMVASPHLAAQNQSPPLNLEGLWHAKLRFGPDVRGPLVIDRPDGAWRVSIAGRSATGRYSGDTVTFKVPGGAEFTGRISRSRNAVIGHWIEPRTRMATPVTLASCGPSCYRGDVALEDDGFNYYLKVKRRPDGALAAFLRNPERNIGGPWIPVARIERTGSKVALLNRRDSVIVEGSIRGEVMTIPLRGGTYDFTRVPDTAFTNFYPRGRPTVEYTYVAPRKQDDGWPVGNLAEVGISTDTISALVRRLINEPIDSVAHPQTHALLIARHGKLVLEEYFFGEHAEKPHDTRSASKTYASTLIGAAQQAGIKISHDTQVYAALRPNASNLPPRKQAMTLEHLMTMSAGLDCDDSGERPGDEDVIQNGPNPDWTQVSLDLDMVREPGASAAYCSMQAHLSGSVLARVARRSLQDLMWELLAEPLQMRNYNLTLTPAGDVYFGGGHRYRARDFAKLAQLYLNGGTWNGRRIVSKEWVDRSIVPRYKMGANMYGYQWWIREYPYRGRTVKAYYAAGNGSQFSMWIPELDLVIASFGANYNSPSINFVVQQIIPRQILPAVEPGK